MHHSRILRGVAALAVLTILVFGIPVALIALAGNPLPDSMETLTHALSSPDLGGTFLMGTIVPILAWVAWAYLASCVVAESVDIARHGRPRRRHASYRNPGRRLASSLVTAVVIMVGGSTLVAPAYATPVSTPADSTASATADTDLGDARGEYDAAPAHGESSAEAHDPTTVEQFAVTVREGDSLWALAVTHLGDGSRYPEIVALNRGVAQADGTALGDDLWLTPGWRIALPVAAGDGADAQAVDPRPGLADVPEHDGPIEEPSNDTGPVVIVEAGDTLWDLAAEHLGDASRYGELAHASSFDDPGSLHPGDVIVVPTDPSLADQFTDGTADEDALGGSDAEATATEDTESAASTAVPAVPVTSPAPAPDERAEPGTETDTTTALEATSPGVTHSGIDHGQLSDAPHATTTPAGVAGDQASAAEDDVQVPTVDLQTVGGVGGALAAGLLGWLAVRRMLQRRRRRPGERIAMPDPPAAGIEEQLRVVDGTTRALVLDHALRFVAAQAQNSGEPMPHILVARVANDEIALYLDGATDLPVPFVPDTEDGSAWTVRVDDLPSLERVPSAPCPSLVSIGKDASGALLFIDLEQVGTLGVTGDKSIVRAALLAMSLELATSTWGDDLRVTLVGFDDRLTDELATGRVRHVSDIDELCDDLSAKRSHVRRALDELDAASPADARTLGPDSESWGVDVVLVGAPLPEPAGRRLTSLAGHDPGVGIAAVFGAEITDGWQLELHDDGDATLVLPGGGHLDLDPQLLVDFEYERLIELARITSAEAMPSEPSSGRAEDWTLSLTPIDTEPVTAMELQDDEVSPGQPDEPLPAPPALIAPRPETPAASAPLHGDEAAWNAALDELAPEIEAAEAELAKPTIPAVFPGSTRQARRRRSAGDRMVEGLDAHARTLLSSLADRPWVRLLGPVELKNAAGTPPITPQTNAVNNSTVKRATELVAYLALHPGASTEQFHAAFWPGKDPRGKTAASNRNGLATRARKWLGSGVDGAPYFPHVGNSGYRLSDAVTTDWHVFLELVGDDLGSTPLPRLRAALDLVQGQPFAGVKERFYGWAEVTRMDMLATVGDACHELAARAIREGDAATARTSAALGREIDPINETSWRDALQAELLAGDPDGFDRIVTQLIAQLDEFEDGYEPEFETQELIELGRRSRSSIRERAGARP